MSPCDLRVGDTVLAMKLTVRQEECFLGEQK